MLHERISAILLAMIMVLTLAGCKPRVTSLPSEDEETSQADTSGKTTPTTTTPESTGATEVIPPASISQTTPPPETTGATVPTSVSPPTIEVTTPTTVNPPTTEATTPTTANPPTTVPPVIVTIPVETQPPHTHSYNSEVISPGCVTGGYTIFTCSCGDVYQADAVTAAGHKWGDWTTTKAATASEAGEETRTCSTCGATESRAIDKLPAETTHTHNYSVNIVPATCVADGYTAHSCSCGDSYTDSPTKATGHSWGQWLIVKDATTTEEGQNLRVCASCEATEIKATPVLPDDSQPKELFDPATDLEAEIARLILEYINQHRKDDGSTQLAYLPGMCQVAQYRSRQLVTNLAHNDHDKREALAYYKYGSYVDLTQFGYDKSYNYYEADTKEAIGKTDLQGTAEEVARELTRACRGSALHWDYVGNSKYNFAGVGVTYADGEYFVCIMVGRTNYG